MNDKLSPSAKAPTAVGLYLAGVQFLFAVGWIVYVIYLPALAAQAGLPKSAVPWLLLMDQLIFLACDLAVGVWSDRAAGVLGRIGWGVLGVTLLSTVAFLVLPWVAPRGSPGLFVAITALWAATSAALRAPPLTLLGRYVAKPAVPWLVSLVLLGTGIAAAIGPYLGLTLKGLDPRLPFALAGLSLAAITAGMVWAERALAQRQAAERAAGIETAAAPPASRTRRDGVAPILGFLPAVLLAAAAAQVHAHLLAAPLYLRLAPASMLPMLLPVFWVGFNLALMPASLAVTRFGAWPVMAGGVLAAAACSAGVWNATSLEAMLPLQGLAGAAWGVSLMSAFSAAVFFGQVGREGFMGGALNSALAAAALSRIAVVTFVAPAPVVAAQWGWVPALLFALSGALLCAIGSRSGSA
ncbi:MFS transporter [Rubrivivax rivuli]|uniref:MFS transporter n=1 Tax=Rubrivivax rivuli TaxID=1862385 RepID=A0A437RAN4_9BURK|nr:MFS transporter [Rubrivivax rivuli]RVU43795.1 MFS transporter [Rubrivivax rivuli]